MGQHPLRDGVISGLSVILMVTVGACSSATDSTGFQQGPIGVGEPSASSSEGLLEELREAPKPDPTEPATVDAVGDDTTSEGDAVSLDDVPVVPSDVEEGDADTMADAGPEPEDITPGLDVDDTVEADGSEGDADEGPSDADVSDDDGAVEPNCVSDEDCAEFTGDDPCRSAVCDEGICVAEWAVDGTACDDGDPCTIDDHCELGACEASTPFDCNDGDPCTEDTCWSGVGCVQQPVNCDDGDPCTIDACDPQSGCVTKVITCPPSENPCLANSCDVFTGTCVTVTLDDGLTCDDQDSCTSGEVCASGACVGESVCTCQNDVDCADASTNLCAGISVCDLDTNTCVPDPATAVVCPATTDGCTVNVCEPATGQCAEVALDEGTICDALGPCDAAATCESGSCVKTPVVCDDEDICTVDTCDPTSGECTFEIDVGTSCDDGDPCTQGETCTADGCGAGESVCECQDNADCQQDYDVCAGVPFCNSQNLCEVDASTALVCDGATDPCQQEVCSSTAGGCVVVDAPAGLACDAGVCAQEGACLQGECIASPVNCDDGDACTEDSCSETLGGCVNELQTGTTCDDGNPCTSGDLCDGGLCVGGPSVCECTSNEDCVAGWDYCLGLPSCDSGTNTCVAQPNTAPNCDGPQEACLVAGCDPSDGSCMLTPSALGTPCDDGEVCTVSDTCADGECVSGAVDGCDDSDACTTDSCVAGQGCEHTAIDCDDSDACTTELCSPALGCQYAAILCEAPDAPCKIATCTSQGGCAVISVEDGVGCDDGDACTSEDSCDGGECQGKAQVCLDGLECTIGSCEAGQCEYTPKPAGVSCDDENACTEGDVCDDSGQCAGTVKACDDGLVCTESTCVSGECVNSPLTGPQCDDADLCTSADTCEAGVCEGQEALPEVCDDDDPCTTDACVDSGCLHVEIPGCGESDTQCIGVVAGTSCDDDDDDTTADMCLQAQCAGFVAHELTLDLFDLGFDGLDVQLTGVGYGEGEWYAIGFADGGFAGQLYSASALLRLDTDGELEVLWNTVQEAPFRDIHDRVAVDDAGKVWWLKDDSWSKNTLLSAALADSGAPDRLLVVTSLRRGKTVRVWMQGEKSGQDMYSRVCDVSLKTDGSMSQASCES
ncbi:MAG: hypothetical protein ACPGU1_22990, partial [Myxococcota bacterium]